MSFRWKLVRAAGPVLRFLPPWYRVRAYGRLSGNPFEANALSGQVARSIQPHGYRMRLDLADWMERFAAITGLYYEIEATRTLERVLRPGDWFIDVGGNLGFLSLCAARIVGDAGHVIHVEPNQRLSARFRETCRDNGLTVSMVEAALGASRGEAALDEGGHHGTAQLREGRGVTVMTGDDLSVPDDVECLVKIDTEGFEGRVLAGMDALLRRPGTSFFVEVTDEWLRRNGDSAASLFADMAERGYRGFLPRATATGLEFTEIDAPLDAFQYDALFLKSPEMMRRKSAE